MEDSMMLGLGCKGKKKVQGLQCRSLVHQLSSSILYFTDLFNFRVHEETLALSKHLVYIWEID